MIRCKKKTQQRGASSPRRTEKREKAGSAHPLSISAHSRQKKAGPSLLFKEEGKRTSQEAGSFPAPAKKEGSAATVSGQPRAVVKEKREACRSWQKKKTGKNMRLPAGGEKTPRRKASHRHLKLVEKKRRKKKPSFKNLMGKKRGRGSGIPTKKKKKSPSRREVSRKSRREKRKRTEVYSFGGKKKNKSIPRTKGGTKTLVLFTLREKGKRRKIKQGPTLQ